MNKTAPITITYKRAHDYDQAFQLQHRFIGAGFKDVRVIHDEQTKAVTVAGEVVAAVYSYAQAHEFLGREDKAVKLKVKVLRHGEGLELPSYETAGAAGMDLRAALTEADYMPGWDHRDPKIAVLAPGEFRLIPTGVALEIPEGYEVQVRPRSGLAAKFGVSIVNTPGTVDSDYRGEIKVCLINHGSRSFEFKRGDRIAQMVVSPVTRASLTVVDDLDQTQRGTGGFGSTGR